MREEKPSGPKQILFVCTTLALGGTERHLLQVLPRLDRRRFLPKVFALRGGALEFAFREAGIEVHLASSPPAAGSAGRMLRWLAQLWRIVRQTRPDVLHFFLPEAYLAGGMVGVAAGHSAMLMSRRSRNFYQRRHPLAAHCERWLHGRMRMLLANSQAVREDLIAEGVLDTRIRLIYNGIDTARFAPGGDRVALRACLGVPREALVVIIVANLMPYKGHADLVRALAAVPDLLPRPWRLLCVGRDEGVRAELERLAAVHRIDSNVLFLGQRDDIPELMAASDLAVSASHEEGFSNSVLEAMAAGLPIVATDAGGNAEAVVDGATGVIVPPADSVRMARAIATLAADPDLRRRMGDAGRTRVAERFSLMACVAAYEDLYNTIAPGETQWRQKIGLLSRRPP